MFFGLRYMFLHVVLVHDIWGDKKLFFLKSPNSLKSFLKRRWTSTNMNTYICLIYKSQLSDLMISNTRQNKMLYYLINSLLSDWLKSNMLDNVHLHLIFPTLRRLVFIISVIRWIFTFFIVWQWLKPDVNELQGDITLILICLFQFVSEPLN